MAISEQLLQPRFLADAAESLWFPRQASSYAMESDGTYRMILWISIAFFFLVLIPMVMFVVKYRQSKGGRATSRVRHHNLLETAWSVIPSLFLVVMFVRGSWGYLDMQTPPEGARQLDVKAYSWAWTVDYGNGALHPELHVVKDQPTKLVMRSTDVLHAFFVPAFRIKRDIVPGRYNNVWFNAVEANERVSEEELQAAIADHEASGDATWDYDRHGITEDGYTYFDLFCAEYCGRDHSAMQSYVVVHETQEDLDAWIKKISSRGDTPPAEYGEKLYKLRNCVGCHSTEPDKRVVGPSFANLYGYPRQLQSGETVVADEQYIRESIYEPKAKIVATYNAQMPSFKGQLNEDDIQSLIAFMKTLSDRGQTASDMATEGEEQEPAGSDDSQGSDADSKAAAAVEGDGGS